jgi:hypothetical protein
MHPRSQNTREAVTDKEHLPRVAKSLARERSLINLLQGSPPQSPHTLTGTGFQDQK